MSSHAYAVLRPLHRHEVWQGRVRQIGRSTICTQPNVGDTASGAAKDPDIDPERWGHGQRRVRRSNRSASRKPPEDLRSTWRHRPTSNCATKCDRVISKDREGRVIRRTQSRDATSSCAWGERSCVTPAEILASLLHFVVELYPWWVARTTACLYKNLGVIAYRGETNHPL